MLIEQVDHIEVKSQHLVFIVRVDLETLREVEVRLVIPGWSARVRCNKRSEAPIRVGVDVCPLSTSIQVDRFDRRSAACQAHVRIRATRASLISTLEEAECGSGTMAPRELVIHISLESIRAVRRKRPIH